MKVLTLTSSYPRYEGDPTAPFIESITRNVAARGHTVHLVVPANSRWRRPPEDGTVHYHPYRYSPIASWTPWGYSESLEAGVKIKRPLYALAPLVALAALRTSNALLSRERFDLVHTHWVIPNGPIGARAAGRHRLPLVVSLHGSDMAVAERSRAIGRAARWCFERAAAVTAPSEDLLERARRLGANGLLERIPYGVDLRAFDAAPGVAESVRERLGIASEHTVVAGIGRFVPVKGFEYLVSALAKASTGQPQIRLLLVGDGDIRDHLAACARRLGVDSSVMFAGMADREAIPAYLAATDIVVVPSVHYEGYVDGLPNVALEAMAAGKPLVATRVGGLPELVRPGVNGLLVDEQDADALAEAIVALARDPAQRSVMGENGRRLVRDSMSWEATAVQFESLYERVTARVAVSGV